MGGRVGGGRAGAHCGPVDGRSGGVIKEWGAVELGIISIKDFKLKVYNNN